MAEPIIIDVPELAEFDPSPLAPLVEEVLALLEAQERLIRRLAATYDIPMEVLGVGGEEDG